MEEVERTIEFGTVGANVIMPTDKLGDTEVYVGDNVFEGAADAVKKYFAAGSVGVVCDGSAIGERFASKLRGEGLKPVLCPEGRRPPDYVRYVVGVGAETEALRAEKLATELNSDWSMVLVEPSTDVLLAQALAPLQVFVDAGVLNEAPPEAAAAGEGLLAVEPLNRFEEYFRATVLGEKIEPHGFAPSKERVGNAALAKELLRLSYDRRGRKEGAAAIAARLMQAKDGSRRRGEYAFIAGYALSVLYADYLRAPSLDTLLPAEHFRSIEKIASLYTMPCSNLVERVDFLTFNDYFRINYILNEYRLDLLEKLNGNDLRGETRRWRRLYPDAGYWLKTAYKSSDVLTALSLAGELCGGLLGFVKASGALEGFVKAA